MLSSPIPGPLPSPSFSFGAASTQSASSPNSADSERHSPDSFGSLIRGEDEDDDTSTSYDAFSRFGSFTSVATSDSSVHSAFGPESAACDDFTNELHATGRRDSVASGQFLNIMSNLDVNGLSRNSTLQDLTPSAASFVSHESNIAPNSPLSLVTDPPLSLNYYSSPSSKIPLDGISNNELGFALHGQLDASRNNVDHNTSSASGSSLHSINSNQAQSFYSEQSTNPQLGHLNMTTPFLDFNHFDQDGEQLPSGHCVPFSSVGSYPLAGPSTALQLQMNYNQCQPIDSSTTTTSTMHGMRESVASFS